MWRQKAQSLTFIQMAEWLSECPLTHIQALNLKHHNLVLAMTQIQHHQALCCTQWDLCPSYSTLATAAGDQWPIITIGFVLQHKCTTWESRVKTLLQYWPSADHLTADKQTQDQSQGSIELLKAMRRLDMHPHTSVMNTVCVYEHSPTLQSETCSTYLFN